MAKAKREDSSYSIRSRSQTSLWPIEDPMGKYKLGAVHTRYGTVAVYSGEGFCQYRMAYRGRLYTRNDHRSRTSTGIAIMAGAFARDVALGRLRA